MQAGSLAGAEIHVASLQQQLAPRARTAPPRLAFRPFPNLIDRHPEVDRTLASFQSESASAVEFYGEPGIGKTSLLRHLSHQSQTGTFPDGIICLTGNQAVLDILQFLFDAFHECDMPYKASPAQIRHALQDRRALIMLDDVELTRLELEELMHAAPQSTFHFSATEQRLWGEGESIELRGLPESEVLALLERELRRAIPADERQLALQLCGSLGNHPERVLLAGALIRRNERSLAELARLLQSGSPHEVLSVQATDGQSEPERRAVAVLAAFARRSVGAQHLGVLAGLDDVDTVIELLEDRQFVESGHDRYRLVSSVATTFAEGSDLTGVRIRALEYFSDWAEQLRESPETVVEEAGVIGELLQWAVTTGRWSEVLRLARAVERPLALDARWEAWADVLERALEAARQLGVLEAEAWALHQLGTRALCVGATTTAREQLSSALRIRQAIDDMAGAAVTRHNLEILWPRVSWIERPVKPLAHRATGEAWRSLVIVGVAVLGIGMTTTVPISSTRTTPTEQGNAADPSVTSTLPLPGATVPDATPTVESKPPFDTNPPELALPGDIDTNATSPSGAVVTFTTSATDPEDGEIATECHPASGELFKLGSTMVTCSARDGAGNIAEGRFTVTVRDPNSANASNLPPVLSLPWDMPPVEGNERDGARVRFTVSVTDQEDEPDPSPSCTFQSGALFAVGRTRVDCSAIDSGGMTATASFTVIVQDTTPPALNIPTEIAVKAASADGREVTFTDVVSAQDIVDPAPALACSPASGSFFRLGLTTVDCSAEDRYGNQRAGSFVVIVYPPDAGPTPPTLRLPPDKDIEGNTRGGAIVTFPVWADDREDDPAPKPNCDPISGSVFPVGTTPVQCSVTDSSGLTAEGSFTVTVHDTTAPELQVPAMMTAEATSREGAAVFYSATAIDVVDPVQVANCSPVSGAVFPLGPTEVSCSARDLAGNDSPEARFTVHVRDTQPPVIEPHGDVTGETNDDVGAMVDYVSSATSDAVDGSGVATCTPGSGSLFPVDETLVTCTAQDRAGNQATPTTFRVIVAYHLECDEPVILGFGELWHGNEDIRARMGCPHYPERGFEGGAWQPFQSGEMIWLDLGAIDTPCLNGSWIFVVDDDDDEGVFVYERGLASTYHDTFGEGDLVSDPGIDPDPGYYQPENGFGKVWREEPGVREALGWAVERESSTTAVVQRFDGGFMVFLDKFNNERIWVFDITGCTPSDGSWELYPDTHFD